ncbi:MAG: GldG family protein [Myxococcota bacterium]
MRVSIRPSGIITTLALLLSVIFINLLSLRAFVRFDLTEDGKYTLADVSRATVATLEDVMVVHAYFSRDLPSPYAGYARYARDLLEEYRLASNGRFTFAIVDPAREETKSDRSKKQQQRRDVFGRLVREPTSVELDLASLGVQPVQVRVIEDDAHKLKQVYMGLVIRYRGKHETVGVVQNIGGLEKEMTVLMRKLTRERAPVLGIMDESGGMRTGKFRELIAQSVDIKDLDPRDAKPIPDDVDALLFMGKAHMVPQHTVQLIDAFLANGHNATFLLDPFDVNLGMLTASSVFRSASGAGGLYPLLQSYGIRIGRQLVADVKCANIPVQEQQGGVVLSRSVPYPFVPDLADFEAKSPITRRLQGVMWPFAAAVHTQDVPTSLSAIVLARSGAKSWLENEPFDINPRRNWNLRSVEVDGPHPLLVQVQGKFPSRALPLSGTSTDTDLARIVVGGTSAILWDPFVESEANANLAMNLVDAMVAEQGLLDMRTRDFIDVPLRQDLQGADRNLLKYGNIIGAPLALILIGLFRWSLRELYRKTIRVKLLDPTKRNKRDPSILL